MAYFVLVPDDLEREGLALLRDQPGLEVFAPGKMTRDDTLAQVPRADGLIVRSGTQVDADLLAHAPELKVVVRAGVGVDNIDLDACTARGIVVMNAPDGNTVSTAELAFGLILALARHIPRADASMRAGRWDRKQFMGMELHGKTLGIIGMGRVGRALAERARAFGMAVVAFDPFVPERAARHLGLVSQVDDVYAKADILSLHALVVPETQGMINAAAIEKMKPGVLIVNTARGKLINGADLAAALRSGQVGGAAIDVYDVEPPPPDHPLAGLDNVILIPHLGASTSEAQAAVGIQAAEQVINYLIDGKTENVRNRAVLDRPPA
ncbi:MAG: hypothetical protein IT325_04765 [Anaerolineae bacterium]|nr:hypothetical protein [Anaerolineae bacterium]